MLHALGVSSVLLVFFVAPLAAATPAPPRTPPPICRAGENAVVVDTGAHRLHLCWRGEIERTFVVALGIDGVDKRREGDNRTPLGTYPLGAPRVSQHFHTFVPVGYPTLAQARMGFTGSAIGIHGPPRGVGGLVRLVELVRLDWTEGCIALATDEEIDEIAGWLRRREVKEVRLVR
jgi:L,D-peptidoglycan transpeptidase YkuD (ErfK/YbiS/YcfS/YnhG family)